MHINNKQEDNTMINFDEKVYMKTATGYVDNYDGWWYENEKGEKVNAVDLGEVVEVAVKYRIDTDDNEISGSGCDMLFDSKEDAEWHMRNYTEEEKKHLVIVEDFEEVQ